MRIMSKGLGKLQRRALDFVAGHPHAQTTAIVQAVSGRKQPTDSDYSAIRRALRTLERRGRVQGWQPNRNREAAFSEAPEWF